MPADPRAVHALRVQGRWDVLRHHRAQPRLGGSEVLRETMTGAAWALLSEDGPQPWRRSGDKITPGGGCGTAARILIPRRCLPRENLEVWRRRR